jgi:phosphoesterase family protein/centrosomal CEP192-like protein
MKRICKTFAVLICSLCLAASWASAPTSAQTPAATSTTLPAFGHAVIVLGENSAFGQTYNSGAMPYLDSLANKYGLSINYWADTHPSIGNYLNISGGNILTNDDSVKPGGVTTGESVAKALENAGKTWKDYEESTNGCGALNSGSYYVRHDPLRYYSDVNGESAKFVCMSTFDNDVSAHTLPNFSYLAPNGCDDAHDCSLGTFDNWLKTEIAPLLASSYFQSGGDGLLIVTFDEDDGSGSPSCSTTTSGQGCGGQVETVVISPQSKLAYQSTAGDPANFSGTYEEANILRTIAQGLGASSSGLAAAGSALPMADFFNVTTTGSVTISPTSLNFGNVGVGTTSAAQSLALKNGTGSAASVNISITGTNASYFSESNGCGSSLAAGASCTISVKFTPGTAIAAVATLNTGISGVTAALAGTGVTTTASVSPTSLTFASQTVGTTSAAQPATLTNTGTVSMVINSIVASANFGETNTCGASLAAGAKCTINVTFTPSTTGTLTGTITINDTASTSPQKINVSGTGVSSTLPVVSLSPTSLAFPSTTVGTTSAAQAVTLKNSGGSSLTISSISITGTNSGDFKQSNNCGSSVAAGASCAISVTFTPTATGTRTAAVSIADNASGSPQMVGLTGTGASSTTGSPVVSLSPTSLTFPSQTVGTTSTAQPVTLKNTGTASLSITSISITGTNSGDFKQSNGCGSSVAAGASCTINVTFTPTATGTRTASVSIADNASGSPQTVSLTGTGASSSTTCGSTIIGGNFYVATTGSNSNNGSCANPWATIQYASNHIGPGATVNVASGTYAGNILTNTSGTSTSRIYYISSTPYGAKIVNSSYNGSLNQNVWDNEGSFVTIRGFDISGDSYQGIGNGGSNVVIKANHVHNVVPQSCNSNGGAGIDDHGNNSDDIGNIVNDVANFSLGTCGFTHGIYADRNGGHIWNNLIYHNWSHGIQIWGSSGPQNITISGNTVFSNGLSGLVVGADNSAANGMVVTDNIFIHNANWGFEEEGMTGTNNQYNNNLSFGNAFGFFNLQTGTASHTVEADPLLVNYQTDGGDDHLTSTSPAINAGTSQGAPGSDFSGNVRPQIRSTGNGWDIGAYEFVGTTSSGPAVSLSPTSLTFASQTVGTTSAAQPVTLKNTGNASLSISSIAITGTNIGDFAANFTTTATPCPISPSTLAAGASCIINVTFKPTATGTRSASLTVTDNASGSPQKTSLTGTGVSSTTATVTISPNPLVFPTTKVGSTSAVETATLTNNTGGALTITAPFTITGDFHFDNNSGNCPAVGSSIPKGGSCTITAYFQPTATGTRTGTVTVLDSAGSQTLSLSGSGD